MEKKYILNRETGKIELHFEKSEYQEMPEDKKRILRSNYLFSRKAEAWVSRAKYPNLYSAKRAAEQLGFTEGEKVGERLTYAEQLQRQTDRAEARADRYLGYAENAERRGAELQKELDERRGDIAFFTQPIIPDTPARRALQSDAEESMSDTIRAWKNIVKASILKSVRKLRRQRLKMPN